MPTTTSAPILIWQPEGGVPVGPVSNPPVYSQADVTPLILGQAYVDVVFGSIQTTTDWVLVECDVVNTVDLAPLNIWPGIITNRTTAGFRLQLNGMPDSGNYYLHWAVSGVNIVPSPASTYQFSGPASGGFGVPSTFTVSLPPSTTLSGVLTITPSDGGAGGVFSPASVTLSTTSASATFTYTPASYGAKTISVTNSGTLTNPVSLTFTVVASTYTLTGPGGGNVGVASTNFTVALPGGSSVIGAVIVTPNDSSGGGTFTPTTVNLTTGAPSATFTYTPGSAGTKTIGTTNNGGLTDPTGISYVAVVPFDPTSIAGLGLWWKVDAIVGLTDGASLVTIPDSAGNNNVGIPYLGTPVYKTNIVNGKPVLRFTGSQGVQSNFSSATLATSFTLTTAYTIFAVAAVGSTAGVGGLMCAGTSPGAVFMRSNTGDVAHYHNDSGFVSAIETSGWVVGAWNVVTADWNGSNIHLWRNGTLKATTGTTLMGATSNSLATGTDFLGDFWNGDIAELLVYTGALSTTDRQNVEAYLKTKYATP